MKRLLFAIGIFTASILGNAQTKGNALRFNGTSSYLRGALPAYFADLAYKDITIDMWLKISAAGYYNIYTAQLDQYRSFAIGVNDNLGTHQILAQVNNGDAFSAYSSLALPINTWFHLAVTWDATEEKITIYINGVSGNQTTPNYTTTFYDAANKVTIGSTPDLKYKYPGEIDELRIWNLVMSSCQVDQAMRSDFTSTTTQYLWGAYNFNQGIAGGDNSEEYIVKDLKLTNHLIASQFDFSGYGSNYVTSGAQLTKTNVSIADNTNKVAQIGNVLKAELAGATYQWYIYTASGWENAVNGTSQSFTPTKNGGYMVKITKNGCAQLSRIISYVTTATSVIDNSKVNVYTKPTGETTIDLGEKTGVALIEVYNTSGLKVDGFIISNQSTYNFTINQPAGVYIVRVTVKNQTSTHKVIKN